MPWHLAEARRDLLRDGAGRLAQRARELEGDRRPEVAQCPIRRRLDRHAQRIAGQIVELRQNGADTVPDPFVQRKNHD